MIEGRSSAAVRVLSAPVRLARTLAGESDRAIRLTLGVLLAVLALSVVLLRIGYRKLDGAHMTVLDAIYFTIETVGTIGYGDYYFVAQLGSSGQDAPALQGLHQVVDGVQLQ